MTSGRAIEKDYKYYKSIPYRNVAQSCPTLCDPTDCSLPGSSVHGIFQAIVLEGIAISFSSGSSWPRDRTRVSRIVDRHFTVWATREVPLQPNVQAFHKDRTVYNGAVWGEVPDARGHWSRGRRVNGRHLTGLGGVNWALLARDQRGGNAE